MTTERQLYNLRNPVEIIQSLNGLVRFRTSSGVMHTEPIDIFERNYELVKVDGWRDIVDKQRAALEFYGDTNNYKEGNTIRPYERHFPVLEDAGVIAIKALALIVTDKENG